MKDVALYQLHESTIKPICLPVLTDFSEAKKGLTAGWGKMETKDVRHALYNKCVNFPTFFST